jgi:DNA polymerase-1
VARRLLFDLEGDGLLPELTKIHCIAAVDPDTRQRFSWRPHELPQAYETLASADELWAHYGLGYDFPALEKVAKLVIPIKKRRDSVVTAKLKFPNLRETDGGLVLTGRLPKELHGSHKLKAWGFRLGVQKADYDGPWGEWSEQMHSYMDQDVETLLAIWDHLKVDEYSQQAIELEHRIQLVCNAIEEAGWPFDVEAAKQLHTQITAERALLEQELIAEKGFGSWYEPKAKRKFTGAVLAELAALPTPFLPGAGGGQSPKILVGTAIPFVPKRDNHKLGYVAGAPCTQIEKVTFNPSSRPHIHKRLMKLGWKPTTFTDGGQPKIDEPILLDLAEEFPAASKLIRYLMLDKRLGMLADGNGAWLNVVKDDGRIHASYNPMGTVTGRAAHFSPNIAQVPALKDRKGRVQPFGAEFRSLFYVPPDWGSQIGADMEGLELRCLAHYLDPFDGGEYGRLVLDGDVHTFNQQAAGLPSRDNAKTFIYAWLYGAGNGKIGKIVSKSAAVGKQLSEAFLAKVPAVARLKQSVKTEIIALHNWLYGLDGRLLPIRSDHSALNTLLQSAGAILCKQWVCDAWDALQAAGLVHGWRGDFVFLGWIHDELQVAARKGREEQVAQILTDCARSAGTPFNFRVRLDSKAKTGHNWKDCH